MNCVVERADEAELAVGVEQEVEQLLLAFVQQFAAAVGAEPAQPIASRRRCRIHRSARFADGAGRPPAFARPWPHRRRRSWRCRRRRCAPARRPSPLSMNSAWPSRDQCSSARPSAASSCRLPEPVASCSFRLKVFPSASKIGDRRAVGRQLDFAQARAAAQRFFGQLAARPARRGCAQRPASARAVPSGGARRAARAGDDQCQRGVRVLHLRSVSGTCKLLWWRNIKRRGAALPRATRAARGCSSIRTGKAGAPEQQAAAIQPALRRRLMRRPARSQADAAPADSSAISTAASTTGLGRGRCSWIAHSAAGRWSSTMPLSSSRSGTASSACSSGDSHQSLCSNSGEKSCASARRRDHSCARRRRRPAARSGSSRTRRRPCGGRS